MPVQKEGVVLAAEGVSRFISVLGKASEAMSQLAEAMESLNPAASSAQAAMAQVEKAAKDAEPTKGAFKSLFQGFGLGVAEGVGLNGVLMTLTGGVGALGVMAGQAAVGGIKNLAAGMASLAQETADIQGVMAQFEGVTQSVEGGTQGMLFALKDASSGMISQRDLMTQYVNAAAMVNTEFAERMPEALHILSKVSAATGKDLNFMMESVVQGVGKLSPMVIDNTTVQVTLAEATARASEELGKEAKSLTVAEKQAAIMSITLERLEENFGDLPDTSQTAAAQMARLGAHFQNIKDTLGQFLLPAFAQLLDAINEMVGSFSMAISEGGALYPFLINIGAALSIVADAFKSVATFVGEWLADMQSDTATTFGDMINDMFTWGVNIVTALANGITEAATTVLDIAMRSIENMLSFWLAPGSPPKVAPQLRNWGVDYMGELLGGMTEADWGILKGIQGPLKKALDGPAFAEASKAITESLAGGDRAGALDTIRKQTGAFGAELAELAQGQFEVADATMAVENAERQLESARKQQLASQQKVSAETAKYNELLREGASGEILDGQLARINMAEQERDTAATVSEEQLRLAQERKASAESALGLQQNVVDELFAYNDALTEQEKAERKTRVGAGAGAKGKGGAATATAVTPIAGGPKIDIAGRIGAAIAASKEKLLAAFSGLFAPLGTAWDNATAKLGAKWDEFVVLLGEAWTGIKKKWPGLQVLEDWIVGLPEKIGTLITDGWDKLMGALDAIWDFVEKYLLPIVEDLGTLGFEVLRYLVLDFIEGWTGPDGLYAKLQKVWKFIKDDLIPFIIGPDGLGPALAWLKEKVVDGLIEGFDFLVTALKGVHTWLGNMITKLRNVNLDKVAGIMGKSPSPLAIGIQTAADAMERMAQVSLPKFNAAMSMTPAMMPAYGGAGGGSVYNNQRSATVNMPTTINSGMDAAGLRAMINRVLREELGRP